MTKELFPCSLM